MGGFDLANIPWTAILGALTAGIAILALVAGARSAFGGRDQVIERLERATGAGDRRDYDDESSLAGSMARALRPLARMVQPSRGDDSLRLRRRLIQAGYRSEHAMEILLGLKLLLAPAAVIVFLQLNNRLAQPLALPMEIAISMWLCGLAYFAPNLWLRGKIQERQTMIERALPDAMDLMVTCVEAGLGLDAALSRVATEIGRASPVLGEELELTFLEIQAGMPRPEAFRRLADRTGVEDLRSLSAMLIQTEMFGTSVGKALRVHSEGMRIKRMQRAEERAAMVAVKLTIPLVLCVLPSLLAVIMGPAVVSIKAAFIDR